MAEDGSDGLAPRLGLDFPGETKGKYWLQTSAEMQDNMLMIPNRIVKCSIVCDLEIPSVRFKASAVLIKSKIEIIKFQKSFNRLDSKFGDT